VSKYIVIKYLTIIIIIVIVIKMQTFVNCTLSLEVVNLAVSRWVNG